MAKILVIVAVLLFATDVLAADEPGSPREIAEQYLALHTAGDIEAMGDLLAPDASFSDTTAPSDIGGPIHWQGREAILSGMAQFKQTTGLVGMSRTPRLVFESNGVTVFEGRAMAYFPTPTSRTWRWSAETITIVTVRDGKVVRHEDFSDYAGAEEGYAPDGEP